MLPLTLTPQLRHQCLKNSNHRPQMESQLYHWLQMDLEHHHLQNTILFSAYWNASINELPHRSNDKSHLPPVRHGSNNGTNPGMDGHIIMGGHGPTGNLQTGTGMRSTIDHTLPSLTSQSSMAGERSIAITKNAALNLKSQRAPKMTHSWPQS